LGRNLRFFPTLEPKKKGGAFKLVIILGNPFQFKGRGGFSNWIVRIGIGFFSKGIKDVIPWKVSTTN